MPDDLKLEELIAREYAALKLYFGTSDQWSKERITEILNLSEQLLIKWIQAKDELPPEH